MVADAGNIARSALYVDALVYRDRDTDGNGSLDERINAAGEVILPCQGLF